MNFREWMRSKVAVRAGLALAMTAGLLLPNIEAGALSVTIIDPPDLESIEFYSPNADLPTAILVPMVVYSGGTFALDSGQSVTFGARNDETVHSIDSVTVNVTGGPDVTASSIGTDMWTGTVDLTDATNAAGGGGSSTSFSATLNAVGTAQGYYVNDPDLTATAAVVTLNVIINNSNTVDTNDDGDPIPDDDQIITILPVDSDEDVVLVDDGSGDSVIVTILEDLAGTGADVDATLVLSGEREADVTITGPLFVPADYASAGIVTNAIVMVTFANSAAELLSSGTKPADLEVVQGLFVRVIVLVSTDNGVSWSAFTGTLPAGFAVDIEIVNADTAVTGARVYGFGLERQDDGTFAPETDAENEEIDPAESATRATVSGGIINAALTNANVMLSVALTGGTATTTTSSGSSSSSTCFIATAAYGTPMAAEIDTLRAVRDTYLLNNVAGAAFVDVYYRLSPAVADKVAESPMLAALVRALLTPFVLLGKLILAAPMALMGLMLAGAGLVLAHRRARSHQS